MIVSLKIMFDARSFRVFYLDVFSSRQPLTLLSIEDLEKNDKDVRMKCDAAFESKVVSL